MSTEKVRARTARKVHHCWSCEAHRNRSGTILPGHRYLLHTIFPGYEYFDVEKPETSHQCVSCATTNDRDGFMEAGACGIFCHGVTPCALPLSHRGNHQCNDRQHMFELTGSAS